MIPRLRLLAAACGTVVLAACGGGGDTNADAAKAEAPGETVSLKFLQFSPNELSVKAGTTVTWRNDEPIGHTVTSGEVTGVDATSGLRSGERPDGRFDGPLTSNGATFAFRFADPGTYSYYCAIHKGMNARVLVT